MGVCEVYTVSLHLCSDYLIWQKLDVLTISPQRFEIYFGFSARVTSSFYELHYTMFKCWTQIGRSGLAVNLHLRAILTGICSISDLCQPEDLGCILLPVLYPVKKARNCPKIKSHLEA